MRKVEQTKALAERTKSIGNFQGYYSHGSGNSVVTVPIQFVMLASMGGYSCWASQ